MRVTYFVLLLKQTLNQQEFAGRNDYVCDACLIFHRNEEETLLQCLREAKPAGHQDFIVRPDSFPSQNENGRTFNQHGRVGDLLKETGFGPDPVPDQIRGVDEQIDVFAEAAQGSFDTAVL